MNDELRTFVERFAAHLQRRSDERQFAGLDLRDRSAQADAEEAEALRRHADGAFAVARALWRFEALLAAAREPRPVLPPGSPAAVKAGCRCDPTKNHDGRGVAAPTPDGLDVTEGFFISRGCPLHDLEEPHG